MLTSSDTAVGITKSIGLGLIGFSEAFDELSPDIVILLGDRFEMFAAASADWWPVFQFATFTGRKN